MTKHSPFASRKISTADPSPEPGVFSAEAFKARKEAERMQKENERLARRRAPLGPIKRWSFSALQVYETCPYQAYLARVEKLPQGTSPALERGSMIHDSIEQYIKGQNDTLCKEARKHWGDYIDQLRDTWHSTPGKLEIEDEWAFTREWTPTRWTADDAWMRAKLDVLINDSETSITIIDWKSGRKWGNEIKHAQQLQLYVISAFLRKPELEFVEGKMVYIDKNDTLSATYTRREAMTFIDDWTDRALKMTTAQIFEPRPSEYACRWCPFAKVQEGQDEPACPHRHIEP